MVKSSKLAGARPVKRRSKPAPEPALVTVQFSAFSDSRSGSVPDRTLDGEPTDSRDKTARYGALPPLLGNLDNNKSGSAVRGVNTGRAAAGVLCFLILRM
jgi:hypothetical protein